MWRRNSKTGDSLFNLLENLRRQNLATVWELSRNRKRRTENSFGNRKPSVLSGNRPETKVHQRQMVKSIRASQASMESGLE